MRGNGLQADSWTSIAEVDPQVADALLELLADAGVAAYAVPSQGRVGGYLDVTPHSRPTDQVFVDSDSIKRAYEVVVKHQEVLEADFGSQQPAPGTAPAEPVDDQTWRDLVGRLEASPSMPSRSEPADDARQPSEWSDVERAVDEREEQVHPELEDDPDDHFVPPEPPPLPESDQLTRWAWAGLLGGPAFLVIMTLLGQRLYGWMVGLSVLAFVGGFGILVMRMKDRPHVDDDPDAGAVV